MKPTTTEEELLFDKPVRDGAGGPTCLNVPLLKVLDILVLLVI